MTDKRNPQSSSSTSSMFASAPAVKQANNSVANWMQNVRASVQTQGGMFCPILRQIYHASSDVTDAELLKRFWSYLGQYLADRSDLWNCDPTSIQSAALRAAQSGLSLHIPNEAHLVGFGGRATLVRGYKGLLKMARRDPRVSNIDAVAVREGDRYTVNMGTSPSIDHKYDRNGSKRGNIVEVYAYAKMKHSDEPIFETMTVAEIIAHAKRFIKAKNKGPFAGLAEQGVNHENFEPYALKTVLMRLANRKLDLSDDLGMAMNDEVREVKTNTQRVLVGEEFFDIPNIVETLQDIENKSESSEKVGIPTKSPEDAEWELASEEEKQARLKQASLPV